MIIIIIVLCAVITMISHNANYNSNATYSNGKLFGCQLTKDNFDNFHIKNLIKKYKVSNYIFMIIGIITIVPITYLTYLNSIFFALFAIWIFLYQYLIHNLKTYFMNKMLREKYTNGFYGKQTLSISFDFITSRLHTNKQQRYLLFLIPLFVDLLIISQSIYNLGFNANTISLLIHLVIPLLLIICFYIVQKKHYVNYKNATKTITDKSNSTKQKLYQNLIFKLMLCDTVLSFIIINLVFDKSVNEILSYIYLTITFILLLISILTFLQKLYYISFLTDYYNTHEEPIVDDDIFFMRGYYYNPFNRHQTAYISIKDKAKMYNHASRLGLFYSRLNKVIICLTLLLLSGLLYSSELAFFETTYNDEYLKIYSPMYTSIIKFDDIQSINYEPDKIEKHKINNIVNNNLSIGKYYTDKYNSVYSYLYNNNLTSVTINANGRYYIINDISNEKTLSLYMELNKIYEKNN